jgi:hypothetical protein
MLRAAKFLFRCLLLAGGWWRGTGGLFRAFWGIKASRIDVTGVPIMSDVRCVDGMMGMYVCMQVVVGCSLECYDSRICLSPFATRLVGCIRFTGQEFVVTLSCAGAIIS